MTTLLTFRDTVKGFYSRYDYILTPVVKFLLALLVFINIKNNTGYMELLNHGILITGVSLICAFLPIEFLAGLGFFFVIAQSIKVSVDSCLVGVALILMFYFGYMRFSPKMGVLVFIVPVLQGMHILYVLPVVAGFLFGPVAIIPIAFGLLLCNYEEQLKNLVSVLATSAQEDEKVQGYHYILEKLISDKEMLLSMVVVAMVILITYLIYRMSFEHSWVVSFVVGGIMTIVGCLAGSVLFSVKINSVPVLIGSILGVLSALVIQFVKGVVDYQRTEVLQFEDDNYYYYVKAVPKLSVAEKKENVKHINSKINS